MPVPFLGHTCGKPFKRPKFIRICFLPFKHHLKGQRVKIKVPKEWSVYPGYLLNGKWGEYVSDGEKNYSLIRFEGINDPISLIDSVIYIKL